VIEGVDSNNIIDVSATKNVEGTKKFFAHDDQGNPLTNLD
jgi:hypothetical protein